MAIKEFCQKKKLPYNVANPMILTSWGFNLKGYFNVGVFNEAHILRNHISAISYSVQWLECNFNLLLIVTPFYNLILDFCSYMPLLFVILLGQSKKFII
jgi:SNF2 family DNA or RNA helicase